MNNQPRWAQRLFEGLIVFVVLAVAAFILFPFGGGARLTARRTHCQSNLKQIALACRQYMQDNDQRWAPVTNSEGEGWADLLTPYLKQRSLFQCPEGYKPTQETQSDYFYNARMANQSMAKVESPPQTILTGDGFDNGSTSAHLSELPSAWKTDESSPAQRHLGGANYAFADGHVKTLRPDRISTIKPDDQEKSIYTLALR